MRFTTTTSLSVLAFSASTQAQDDVNAAAGLQEATFWSRCPDKDGFNLGDGFHDCDCSRDGKPWWDWFGKNTCTVVVTQTVGIPATVPGIPVPNPVTPGCDQNGHCTVTVTQTTFGNPTTTFGQPGFSTQTTSIFSSVLSSASSSISSIESQASSRISSVYSEASSEISRLTSELATATGSDRSSITSEIGRLTSSAASRASSISSQARTSIFRTGAAAPLQTAGVAMGAFFGGVAMLANF
ncbi:hypothetical protein KVR01_001139 [Diaporthe batatas]|uniref:uncharacterized protein n=1 Tax=Diaporthe batatas TaxID=748121 RepID=UPI001D03B816|nr:uncharacterized protein KVR01_001139 [Diaporthe batatas]KAG8168390.1 hypothetical protein KVR01_001139 [Diaporthe batatas]